MSIAYGVELRIRPIACILYEERIYGLAIIESATFVTRSLPQLKPKKITVIISTIYLIIRACTSFAIAVFSTSVKFLTAVENAKK